MEAAICYVNSSGAYGQITLRSDPYLKKSIRKRPFPHKLLYCFIESHTYYITVILMRP